MTEAALAARLVVWLEAGRHDEAGRARVDLVARLIPCIALAPWLS